MNAEGAGSADPVACGGADEPTPDEPTPDEPTPDEATPDEATPDEAGQDEAVRETTRTEARSARRPSDHPVIPDRSQDDRDTGWGETPSDDDERYLRERPPHW